MKFIKATDLAHALLGGINGAPQRCTTLYKHVWHWLVDQLEGWEKQILNEYERQQHEVTFVHGGEPDWVRIGRYDSAQRRSLWCRVWKDGIDRVHEIELCSGREGDDAYVKLTPSDSQWEELRGVLLRVVNDCGLRPPAPDGEP